jgi:hypothetical protein
MASLSRVRIQDKKLTLIPRRFMNPITNPPPAMKLITMTMILVKALPIKPKTPNRIAKPATMKKPNQPVDDMLSRFRRPKPRRDPAPAPSSHI